ncbi:MAG: alpha/beta fold hydrolase [Stenotrophobium sp.]
MPITEYSGLTPWESGAGHGPILRGRRTEGEDATIHFLSGNGFCGGVYWPLLREFLPRHGLFTHDIEGQGDSGNPAHFSGVEAVIKRIPQVIANQGLQGSPLIGMGHSFGAALTLRVAADNPGLFRALVLMDPIVIPPLAFAGVKLAALLGRHPLANGARRRRNVWLSREAVASHLHGRGTYKRWTEEAFGCFVDYATHDENGQRVLSCPRELEAEIFDSPVWPWPAFRKARLPILFLRGQHSFSFFPAAERRARILNPQVVVKKLPGSHCFMQQDPPAAHAVIADFLGGLPR